MHRSYPERVAIDGLDHDLDFMTAYHTYFAPRLGVRAETFAAIFTQVLASKSADLTIVETGCLRAPGNWAGDGQSTFMFDHLISKAGGRVFSVDIAPEAVAQARAVASANVQVVLNDSVGFLSAFREPIDLLYLDSFDLYLDDPMPSAINHLYELCAVAGRLRPGSVVAVDDSLVLMDGRNVGKGMLLTPYMERIGARMIADGYQSAWVL